MSLITPSFVPLPTELISITTPFFNNLFTYFSPDPTVSFLKTDLLRYSTVLIRENMIHKEPVHDNLNEQMTPSVLGLGCCPLLNLPLLLQLPQMADL